MLNGIVAVVECDRQGCAESLSIVFNPNELPLGHWRIRSSILNCGWYAVLRNPKTPWQWATYNLEEAKKQHAGDIDDLRSNSGLYPLEHDKYYCCKECKVSAYA